VDVFSSSACPWNIYLEGLVTEVAEEFGNSVMLERVDCEDRESVLRHGIAAGVALNGSFRPWLHPHPVPTAKTIREAIEDLL
jgi:hypothetical protein